MSVRRDSEEHREGDGRERKGKVILLESVIAAGSTPDFGKFLDIEMLMLPGGRERTADEFLEINWWRCSFRGVGAQEKKDPGEERAGTST